MENKLTVIILAAGKGKRMNNPDLPKVLAELAGKPLIGHVVGSLQNLDAHKIVAIVGFHKELVKDYLGSLKIDSIVFANQDEQLGTGHAVDQARDILHHIDSNVLILAGDVPLIRHTTLKKFINLHEQNGNSLSVLSTIAPNPQGYGRIVRDPQSNFIKITEHKDATESELRIDEINSGTYVVDCNLLFKSLSKVENNNAQKEYYLTDIVSILKSEGKKVEAYPIAEFKELQGVNTPQDLENAEETYKAYTLQN